MTLPPELREKAEAQLGTNPKHRQYREGFYDGVEWLWGEIMKETKGILFDPLLVFTEASQRNETIRELKAQLKATEEEIRELIAECSQLREDNLDD